MAHDRPTDYAELNQQSSALIAELTWTTNSTKDKVCSKIGKKYGLASCRSLWPYSMHLLRRGQEVGELKVVQSAPELSAKPVFQGRMDEQHCS